MKFRGNFPFFSNIMTLIVVSTHLILPYFFSLVSEEPKKKEEKGSLDHHIKLRMYSSAVVFLVWLYIVDLSAISWENLAFGLE